MVAMSRTPPEIDEALAILRRQGIRVGQPLIAERLVVDIAVRLESNRTSTTPTANESLCRV